ncbi:MAG: flagellar basal body rod protein FlgB [Planctomycetes bacterium]|nr:flagellar basal body rod protein FlgB [Planctomycetota bacterium]MBI3835309.1 flagellar basal body rod protein FlgB [Planctomycetota bacterium]
MGAVFAGLIDGGNAPALVNTLSFSEARLRVIADNIANLQTPGYRAKQLDPVAFQQTLRKAITERGSDPHQPLHLRSEQVSTDDAGRLTMMPKEKPAENILFHDGTNSSMELEMSELAKTGMMHDVASRLLRIEFNNLREAIRGTV